MDHKCNLQLNQLLYLHGHSAHYYSRSARKTYLSLGRRKAQSKALLLSLGVLLQPDYLYPPGYQRDSDADYFQRRRGNVLPRKVSDM